MSDGAAPPDDEPTEIIVSVTTEPARSDDDGLDIDRKLAPRARAFPAGGERRLDLACAGGRVGVSACVRSSKPKK
jgi:hypothetical protein